MFSLESFPFAAGIACIFELFGLDRALEHWANAQRKKRDRACQTTTKFILVAELVAPSRVTRLEVGSLDQLREVYARIAGPKNKSQLCDVSESQKCRSLDSGLELTVEEVL